VPSAICQRSAQEVFRDMPQPAEFGGFFFCAIRDMPTVAQTVARIAKNRQRTTLWTVALKRPIFKRKKGSRTLV
jgi:hypothetical protein